ncbi:pollen-specific leucine-rich repeat extensin-like protein 4 [Iris pallida]|uniref:Pollen-specific leucine-rich repeat extensin-like protein 4 n=1 Tax=Iris pallida TaxID=29817 RepID=A0AAX6ECH8_IRIPA|nr:pollen-specific leucine-rich repeat extensin-like protein 4 [Iris pallida]
MAEGQGVGQRQGSDDGDIDAIGVVVMSGRRRGIQFLLGLGLG